MASTQTTHNQIHKRKNKMKWIIICLIIGALIAHITTEIQKPEEKFNEQKIVQLIHQKINHERTQNGLQPLKISQPIKNKAQEYSNHMATKNIYKHSTYTRTLNMGENIAKIPKHYWVIKIGNTETNKGMANAAVTQWMESPGHKQNILTPTYRLTGIGVSCNYEPNLENTYCWMTQNFI